MRARPRGQMLLAICLLTGTTACAVASAGRDAGALPGAGSARQSPNAAAHPISGPACGAATSRTLAAADGSVAERIYLNELVGSETVADQHQVEGYAPLLSALAEGNRKAITEAVHALVYSHTHIVRLRVSQHGSVLADIGGPYIVAPVGGSLVSHGRLLGTYLLSVQDDLGVVGLVKRFIGVPLTLHVGRVRVPLAGTVKSGSVPIPDRGPVTIHGQGFAAFSFDARAFPSGTVRISLLLHRARASARSCAAVRVAELGRVGQLIWRRFVINGLPIVGFVGFLHSHTGALAYIRAGSSQLAGSTAPGPPRLPDSGVVRYRGVSYGVSSFATRTPAGRLRVYQLVRL